MNETQQQLLSTLADEILALAREAAYVPEDGIPYVEELETHGSTLVNAVCAAISEEMEKGLEKGAVVKVFEFVFLQTFDAVYRWHVSADGKVPAPVVSAETLREASVWEMPADLVAGLKELPTPVLLFTATAGWIEKNHELLEKEGLDLWAPLVVGLQMTVTVATSMALKVFDYDS